MTENPATFRLCFAAAHLVMRPEYAALGHSLAAPGRHDEIEAHIDWPATMRLRRVLDGYGMGIAEAMDTAQRFFIGWPAARRLIAECGAMRLENGFCAGAGTDQLAAVRGKNDLVDAVVEQCAFIAGHGGIPVLLPMPWLTANGASEQDYVDVYAAIVKQVQGPVFVHWLGEMFLPALAGYFPGDSFSRVMALDPAVVRGCKLSLLDAELEVRVRRELLPREQIVLTGDDFHFGAMIRGDAAAPTRSTMIGDRRVALGDFSHALLGILDAIAAPTQAALQALEDGDVAGYERRMAACEALGKHVFEAPTQHYKAGLAFLAWCNGLQDTFLLVNREEQHRDRAHYLRCAELARAAEAVLDAGMFTRRLNEFTAGG
ncbi:MAG: DUF993 family protein [Planctomycetes bacterium]|nr:DUF993 family protein [Planctomycetota bacterium]